MSPYSVNLLEFKYFDNIYYLYNKNKKNSKVQNASERKHGWKNRSNESAWVNIFLEHLLTEKFRHYLRINSTSYYKSYIDFYTLTYLYY